mmetsp:Transcript_71682/g.162717  ORF Transcript_71682/g.162717 Transcript_71682/m.162717 type:complete len:232 (-) Transcript_71682:1-696(-)
MAIATWRPKECRQSVRAPVTSASSTRAAVLSSVGKCSSRRRMMRHPYRWHAADMPAPFSSSITKPACARGIASITFCSTKLACGEATASRTCPWSSFSRSAVSALVPSSRAAWTTRLPKGSQAHLQTEPRMASMASRLASPPASSWAINASLRSVPMHCSSGSAGFWAAARRVPAPTWAPAGAAACALLYVNGLGIICCPADADSDAEAASLFGLAPAAAAARRLGVRRGA